MTAKTLTTGEFQWLKHVLRGSLLDHYNWSCITEWIEEELHEAVRPSSTDAARADVAELIGKLTRMSDPERGELLDQLNNCYFAEKMEKTQSTMGFYRTDGYSPN